MSTTQQMLDAYPRPGRQLTAYAEPPRSPEKR
jgi:hypothetical protein